MKINFDELEYNLYEILNLPEDAKSSQIKPAYRNLVLKYHPDKNPDQDFTDILSNVNIAYKVLKKEETRMKYDNYLRNKRNNHEFSHHQIRNNYSNNKKIVTEQEKQQAKTNFYQQCSDLDKKHSYNTDPSYLDSTSAEHRLNVLQANRKDFNVEYASIFSDNSKFNSNTFNEKFDDFKNGSSDLNIHNQEIIRSEQNYLPLAYQPTGNILTQYTPLTENSYNSLYAEDSGILGDNFTSLDVAFSLKDSNCHFDNKSIEERLKDREKQSDKFKARTVEDYTDDTFNYGIFNK